MKMATSAWALLALGAVAQAGEQRVTVEHQGRARTATVVWPEKLAERPALVLALHGVGGDAERLRGFTARTFERATGARGSVLAYPEAFEGVWNDCRVTGESKAREQGVDDVGFLLALVEHVEGLAERELGGVFVVGYSNGGQMALRLAFEVPERVDGVACFGALLPVEAERGCATDGEPVPTLLVAGTQDPICPYEGGLVRPPVGPARGAVLSARESIDWFARRAGHGKSPLRRTLPDRDPEDGCTIQELCWRAPGRAEATLLVVRGGGHALPLVGASFPELVGRTAHDVDGAEELWRFFGRQLERER